MDIDYDVASYHLNVDEGDCAIHSLHIRGNQKNVVSATLVDGGRKGYGKAISELLASKAMSEMSEIKKFHNIVVTHWDSDHIDGVLQVLYDDLQTQVEKFIKGKKSQKNSQDDVKKLLSDAAKAGELQSTLTYYDNNVPITRFYVPYWDSSKASKDLKPAPVGEAKHHKKMMLKQKSKGKDGEFITFIIVPSDDWKKAKNTGYKQQIKIMVLMPMGKQLLGMDIFSGKSVFAYNNLPDSPQDVSRHLYTSAQWKKPVMYCIGSAGYTHCPPDRTWEYFQWTDSSGKSFDLGQTDLQHITLRKGSPAANSDEVSTRLVIGKTTSNNKASIACMIIWPHSRSTRVSHYIAGDAAEHEERLYLRWATVKTDNPNIRTPIRIQNVKLSHHVLRRVIFTQKDSEKFIEVLVQLTFAGMAFLCTLRVDFLESGTRFGLYETLFPETRPALLSKDFLWVPHSPQYEPWKSIEVIPVRSALGVLEDVQVNEVGDLSKSFNALAANQEQPQTLDKSPTSLELVGLQFALTGKEVRFSASVMSDLSQTSKIPALKLLAASLDLRYDIGSKSLSNCSLATSIAMTAPDTSIFPAIWSLMLAYNQSTWTLSGGVTAIRGSLLYSLFDGDANSEMSQMLSKVILDLHLTYNYNSNAEASDLKAEGILYLGHLRLQATYDYPGDGDWTFDASLVISDDDDDDEDDDRDGNDGGDDDNEDDNGDRNGDRNEGGEGDGGDRGAQDESLSHIFSSLYGEDMARKLPTFVADIVVKPVGDADLTSLKIVRFETAILMLVRLQVTATESIAFFQFQRKRGSDKSAPAPPIKRALVVPLGQFPRVCGVYVPDSSPRPLDQTYFQWIDGGEQGGWTRDEVRILNNAAGKDYAQIFFQDHQKASQDTLTNSPRGVKDSVVLRSGSHLCLVGGGDVRLHPFDSGPVRNTPVTAMRHFQGPIATEKSSLPMVNKRRGADIDIGVGLDVDSIHINLHLVSDEAIELDLA